MQAIQVAKEQKTMASQELKDLLEQALELSLAKLGQQLFVEAICIPNSAAKNKHIA